MEVILKEDIENLGVRGQIVKVAAGFGRNYLLPRGLAAKITPGNLKQIEHEKRLLEVEARKEVGAATTLKARIDQLELTFQRRVGETETLYGSVTNADVAEGLAEHGIEIDKRKVVLEEPIKELGNYRVPVRLHREVVAEVKIYVVKET